MGRVRKFLAGSMSTKVYRDAHKLNKNGSATTTLDGDDLSAVSKISIPWVCSESAGLIRGVEGRETVPLSLSLDSGGRQTNCSQPSRWRVSHGK